MRKPVAGFIVYGVHKDGLKDPMGQPFIDDKLIADSKKALKDNGLVLKEYDVVVATKEEAKEAFSIMKKDDEIDLVVLFSGTWVWASNMVAAIRDFAGSGKGILIWTHPGSQGWRPVGGLVLHGGLKEIGIEHKFVYGSAQDPAEVAKVTSYAKACALKNRLNMSTIGTFGGRGMGQTCGVADPAQWMKTFGVDIDSRDTTALLQTAHEVTEEEIKEVEARLATLFDKVPERDAASERSYRLYIAIKKMLKREKWDMYTIQSFPGLGDDYSATCFAQSMILEDRIPTSTLSDFNTAMTVYLLSSLSNEPVYYGDLQHIDKSNNEIKIIGDGAVPPSLQSETGPAAFAGHGIPTEGKAGGLSIHCVCKEGKGVLARFGRNNGQFELTVTRCTIKEPDKSEIEKRRLECGIPFWPHAFVTAECDIDALLENWTNEYAVLGYGEDIYDVLADFCKITGIKAIML